MRPFPRSAEILGAILSALAAKRLMELSLQLGLQRQMKVMGKGSQIIPKKYRKQEWCKHRGKQGRSRAQRIAASWTLLVVAAVGCSSENINAPPDQSMTVYQGFDTDETWNGVRLHIDADVSDMRSPSAP
jgi:hypothetical protein